MCCWMTHEHVLDVNYQEKRQAKSFLMDLGSDVREMSYECLSLFVLGGLKGDKHCISRYFRLDKSGITSS